MKRSRLLQSLFSVENYNYLFFLFLTFVLAGIYVASIIGSPRLREPVLFILFTLAMNLHIVLYWMALWVLKKKPRWLAVYIIFQGLLAFAIAWMSQAMSMIFGLYPGLIGLVIGIWGKSRWSVLSISYFFLLSLVNYSIQYGMDFWMWWAVGMVPSTIFVMIYVGMYLRQAEARERAQKLLTELEVANRQLTEYSAQVEDLTIANERQRMARELHDTLSQGLAGLILQLEAVDAHLASSRPEKARQIVQQTMGKARETLADARRVIDDLRQDQPVEQDIEQAARQEIARFTGATGISCEFSANLTTPCPAALQDTVLRTLSEGLTNVTRHARASQVRIQLSTTADAVHVEIRDNGAGFDPAAVPAGHYGLLGLRERARLAGGTLEIESGGDGTVLRLWVPCTSYGG